MGNRLILDCTLRDGGYINDWEFGHDKIVEIFQRQVSAGIDVIEVGFLDERRTFDRNRTIMPNTQAVNEIFQGLYKGQSTVVAMIDYGTCNLGNIQPCSETFLDGIRVIFKEPRMYDALEFCGKLKERGYKVYAQMVSVTTYTDAKLKEYAYLVNSVRPYATSMVDTYGLMHHKQLLHIFRILDTYLNPRILIGFHAHNNFQMAYSNAIEYLNSNVTRTILADGSLYGMGKSAGNAPIELLTMYMNNHYGTHYAVNQLLEAIDNCIMEIYRKQYWGYNLKYFIASSNSCHPNYVAFLMDKKTLSVKQVSDILNLIIDEKKLLYDEKYIERIYLEYQSQECDDTIAVNMLSLDFIGRDILVLGPGNNLRRQKKKVEAYINNHNPLLISVNFLPQDFKVDYIFLTNVKRYTQLLNDLSDGFNCDARIIATSNVTKTNGAFRYVLNYSSLIDIHTEIMDNSLVMLIKMMIRIGVTSLNLAGFDGYSPRTDNYYNTSREYSFVKEKASYLNSYVRNFLETIKRTIQIEFVTKSRYFDSKRR